MDIRTQGFQRQSDGKGWHLGLLRSCLATFFLALGLVERNLLPQATGVGFRLVRPAEGTSALFHLISLHACARGSTDTHVQHHVRTTTTTTTTGLQGPRVNLTHRWVTQHIASCPFAGVVGCVLPTCVQGLAEPCSHGLGVGFFLGGTGSSSC